jgi:hypothetical protein
MMHLSEPKLRAYLDHQLDEQAELAAGQHLDGCPSCRRRLNQLARRREAVQQALSALDTDQPSNPPGARAYSNLMSRKENQSMKHSIIPRSRLVWAALTLLVVLVVSLSFPTVRAWAGQFLGLFRVEQVTVLPLDISRMEGMVGNTNLVETIDQTLADSLDYSQKPSDPWFASSIDEASAAVGFDLRSPAGQTPTAIEVQDGFAFKFRVDRELAQSILDEAGRSDLVLPETLNNAEISATINPGAVQYFGACNPKNPGAASGDCQILLEIQSPVVDTPPDIDLAQLAQISLMLTGMSEQEATALSRSIDWNATLVVPIPDRNMRYETVTVDGVEGSLIRAAGSDPDGGPQHTILMWVKNGIVYSLTSTGDPDAGLKLANSLR